MIIKETGYYNSFTKKFIVVKYCCNAMEEDMDNRSHWEIDGNTVKINGRVTNYCSYCGEKITIQ